eukprot:CAMPEP_0170753830 /NCGR_PEP_ID=MMETSP0437-20130122/12693_1 /TAXON_ID=0 /ORGANISM="Sexangularia sp." /LENGTH=161 /DNA_ID=CAMNT_0011092957 /DNA_START=314 /DNA_END=799 /DNA_ORIENTATION=-
MIMIASDMALFATALVGVVAVILLFVAPMLAIGFRGATFYPSANCVVVNIGFLGVRHFDFSSDQLDLLKSPVFVEVRGQQVGGGRSAVHESFLIFATPKGRVLQVPVERTKDQTPAQWSKTLEAQLNEIHVVLHRKEVSDIGDVRLAAGDSAVVLGACSCV